MGAGGVHQSNDVLQNRLGEVDLGGLLPQGGQFRGGEDALDGIQRIDPPAVPDHLGLRRRVRIAHGQLDREAVHLRVGERLGACRPAGFGWR